MHPKKNIILPPFIACNVVKNTIYLLSRNLGDRGNAPASALWWWWWRECSMNFKKALRCGSIPAVARGWSRCFQALTVTAAKWILKMRCWWALCHRLKGGLWVVKTGGLRIWKRGDYVYENGVTTYITTQLNKTLKLLFLLTISASM